ncbi:MAG TPA: hypothetical protein DCQ26_05305 [Marinilabiliales bacterium]|nr:MAG: hypothetical protein A2W95_15130 [Bacteroidetes bacterium GWA2_40_14]OFX65440.1 MAG: hypothetical protein A2W84_19050 [Bacteroidetes bacterium GWC2_40_13]OFX73945.1 MAG: hypothetical protein A2W96_11535 [Bacteroidetes bacterium GWD2_40_43]OFX93221.1 MAG: hypothetical protein A2W97_06535 [Bacteroidetes bacterium GWE2_40_63]OFY21591.1 MAG: hypothetical protein A2W88_10535 [Bacteroidetes bacterium GWF2_40_13]OFZ24243.1 MAG: hypothetical protein A2437_17670 [Bacteroidetes bacterium RIFOXYC
MRLQSISKIIFIFLTISFFSAQGQTERRGEVGVFVGGGYLLGDFNKIPFMGTRQSFGAFYRHTFNSRYALSGSFIYGKLYADANKSVFVFPPYKDVVINYPFYELAGQVEYNFLPYLATYKKTKYSPYIFAGMGFTFYSKTGPAFQQIPILVLPFGVGFKYNLYKDICLGFQMGMRKTFSDKMDDDYNLQSILENTDSQYGYEGNKDWYSVFGFYLTYKINYRAKCPAFD